MISHLPEEEPGVSGVSSDSLVVHSLNHTNINILAWELVYTVHQRI